MGNRESISTLEESSSNKKDKEFEDLVADTYQIVNRYMKDQKNPESWIHYYAEVLNIKFPNINFNEGYPVFKEKITKILDIMELTHLYVKIVLPANYKEDKHNAVVYTKYNIVTKFEALELNKFNELLDYIRSAILFGNN